MRRWRGGAFAKGTVRATGALFLSWPVALAAARGPPGHGVSSMVWPGCLCLVQPGACGLPVPCRRQRRAQSSQQQQRQYIRTQRQKKSRRTGVDSWQANTVGNAMLCRRAARLAVKLLTSHFSKKKLLASRLLVVNRSAVLAGQRILDHLVQEHGTGRGPTLLQTVTIVGRQRRKDSPSCSFQKKNARLVELDYKRREGISNTPMRRHCSRSRSRSLQPRPA